MIMEKNEYFIINEESNVIINQMVVDAANRGAWSVEVKVAEECSIKGRYRGWDSQEQWSVRS